MRALFAILIICFLTFPLIMSCKPPGLLCTKDEDCCAPLICNPWAGRCTKKQPTTAGTTESEEPSNPPVEINEMYEKGIL
ncbi:hypothetical protein ANTQUA_LOCUS8040 [Anthophora quadrimaculata]